MQNSPLFKKATDQTKSALDVLFGTGCSRSQEVSASINMRAARAYDIATFNYLAAMAVALGVSRNGKLHYSELTEIMCNTSFSEAVSST